MSFDYIDDIKETEHTGLKASKSDGWVKNSTNIHVPQSNAYMNVYRKA
jgi:hypothetical protein